MTRDVKYITWHFRFCWAELVAGLNSSSELASWAEWVANNSNVQSHLQNATVEEEGGWTDGINCPSQ